MDKKQLSEFIESTLKAVDLYSPEAVKLLMGTAAQESGFCHYIHQLNNGPALGWFQMEPNTFHDILFNFLNYRPDLKAKILQVCNLREFTLTALMYNMRLAVIFCRLHYYRCPGKLPNTIEGMAEYWKEHHNTRKGKGTVEEFIFNYKKYVL